MRREAARCPTAERDEVPPFPFRDRALPYDAMRKSPAPLIAAAVSGALSVVLAFSLSATHAGSSRAMEATVRLGAVAHAYFDAAASKGSDRLEVAPAGASKGTPPAVAVAPPALPAAATLPEIAAAFVSGSLVATAVDTPEGRPAPRAHRARGPPRVALRS